MKKILYTFLGLALVSWALQVFSLNSGFAQPASDVPQLSDEDVKKVVEDYVKEHSVESGTFDIYDVKKQITRKLSLDQIHGSARQAGSSYTVCVDFKDTDLGDTLDIDIVLEDMGGVFKVADARIHSVNGIPRDIYENKPPVEVNVIASEEKSGEVAVSPAPALAGQINQDSSSVSGGSSSSGSGAGSAGTTGSTGAVEPPPASEGDPTTVIPKDSGLPF